jgi:hypothetical protein
MKHTHTLTYVYPAGVAARWDLLLQLVKPITIANIV